MRRLAGAGHAAAGYQMPESGTADRINDKVDSGDAAVVDDAVRAPVIKNPGFSCAHVYFRAIAVEAHSGVCDDGHMDTHALAPVIFYIGVWFDLGTGRQTHEPRTADHGVETCQYLPEVRALSEPRRRRHFTRRIVIIPPSDGNQDER